VRTRAGSICGGDTPQSSAHPTEFASVTVTNVKTTADVRNASTTWTTRAKQRVGDEYRSSSGGRGRPCSQSSDSPRPGPSSAPYPRNDSRDGEALEAEHVFTENREHLPKTDRSLSGLRPRRRRRGTTTVPNRSSRDVPGQGSSTRSAPRMGAIRKEPVPSRRAAKIGVVSLVPIDRTRGP